MKTWEKVQDSVHLGDVPGGCKEGFWSEVRCVRCLVLGLESQPGNMWIKAALEKLGR
jgi:hypothetical protein